MSLQHWKERSVTEWDKEYAAFIFSEKNKYSNEVLTLNPHHIIRMFISENLPRNMYSYVYGDVLQKLALTFNGRPE